MSHIACFCAGAIVALLFAMWMMTRRKPLGITKNARKPVDVPYHERKYRDAPGRRHLYSELCEGVEELKAIREQEEGVRYEWMNLTGEER